MSTPGFVPFIEDRTSTQRPKPGLLEVDSDWYRAYCSTSPADILHGWDALPLNGRRRRAQCRFPWGLKPDVLEKISKLDRSELKRLLNLLLGFEDCFMLSAPEEFPLTVEKTEYRRFMRWAVSSEIYRPGAAISQWKEFITLTKWVAVKSRTPPPPLPTSFPGVPRAWPKAGRIGISVFWARLCPWLVPIWENGLQSKFECTRLAHFLTSRNLPAGTRLDRDLTIEAHAEVLCGEAGPSEEGRARLLYELSYKAGKDLMARVNPSLRDAHLSLTNSASLDAPVNRGGRARDVSDKFRRWISYVPPHDVHEVTWFGKPYWLKAGIPRWRTMCRTEIAPEGRAGDSATISEIDFTPGKYRHEDPIHCLDRYTGYQIYQWALEEGISQGAIVGTPYRSSTPLKAGRPCAIRASAIGEPGGKSRVVTVGEDWLTIFLQPLSHGLISLMKEDPSARAGLSRGWQGFEYVKGWSTKDENHPPETEERLILSSDLKTATDYCPHSYARALLDGFIDGLGLDGVLTRLWVSLLVSPRIYLGPSQEWAECLTARGVLMGDPGAKLVLSLFNKAAEMEAMLRFQLGFPKRPSTRYLIKRLREDGIQNSRFRLFAFAGDDHIAIGPERYLREITQTHIRNGMKVSASSNFISDRAGFYCEEIIFIGVERVWRCWGLKVPLSKQAYEDNPHVDALKIRLLSLCQKEHEGKNETNPAIGMSSTLRGMIAWFAEGWEPTRPIVSFRFHQKMRRLVPENLVLRGIPRSLGGIESPLFGFSRQELLEQWDKMSIVHRRTICLVRREGLRQCQALRRILAKASLATSERGVDLDSIEEEIRSVLSSELCQAKHLDDLRPERISELEWSNLRLFDKFKQVEREGKFIPVGNALQIVMRPYIFRDLLFPEESIAHGIDPYRRRSFRQIGWNERLRRLEAAILNTIGQSDELRELYLSVDHAELERNRDALIESLSQPYLASVPKEFIFIPKEVVYTDSLCTLSTPDITIMDIP
nr:RNA-dependent RNA polymerase [Narnavirus sp.]